MPSGELSNKFGKLRKILLALLSPNLEDTRYSYVILCLYHLFLYLLMASKLEQQYFKIRKKLFEPCSISKFSIKKWKKSQVAELSKSCAQKP